MKVKTMAIIGILLAAVFASCQLGGAEDPAKNLTQPYISVQPESRSFYTDNYAPYELKVDILEWNNNDGSLTYQWYKFEDIDDYCANGGTPATGPGATTKSYTPTDITPEAGKQYYFYILVTNTKSNALDTPTATIQSEVATISFSQPGNYPLFPIIARHPANASYGWGRSLNAVRVEAKLQKVGEGDTATTLGTLTYQWYSNTERKIEGGTPIQGADKASFIPGYDNLVMNNNYYYVKVTNTLSSRTAVSYSIPAIIEMKPGLKAGAPRITQQPVDRIFFAGDTPLLRVEAESPDMGDLSFQWYSSPTPAAKNDDYMNWNLITNATDKTYPPTGSGTSYYYVKVTNTNENVRGDHTAELISKAVKVRFASAAGDIPTNATITIPDPKNSANLRQYVRGYGGMDVAWESFPRTDPADTELMYDPDRLGYNMLRIMITPDNIDIKKTLEDLVASYRPAYFENVKIVNKYGGYVAASPWTPPKEWKSNNSKNGGGNLIPTYYRLFATYLRNFCQIMYDNGAPIYCVSISNEPNYVAGYDGCEWSPEEMRDFWLEVGHFTDGVRGYGGGKEIPYVLTMNGESANTPYINNAALLNPRSKAVIDLLARHIYGERTRSLWNDYPQNITRADGSKMEVWMTEHNINSANATGYYNDSTWNYVWRFLNDVDLVMRINNENAFVWWASKRFYSMVGDGQFGTTEHAPLPRGWALAHYARYTIDTTRIHLQSANITGTFKDGTDIGLIERKDSKVNDPTDNMDNESVRITAYVSQDGNAISMVMWTPTKTNNTGGYDMGDIKINLPDGFLINGVTAHKSWGDRTNEIFQPYDVNVSADRKSAFVTLNRGEILSVKFTK
ncbi:glycoside hydrolase [Treponema sp. R80B11-R83G3]